MMMLLMRSWGCIVLAILLGGCQRETQVQRGNREKILIVGNASDPKSLDLHLVTGVVESKVICSLFEGLVGDHPSSDTVMSPGAATHWEHNADYTEWVFHLRPEAKWSDGEAVTAHDFAFSYQRMLHPDMAAPYVEMLYFIKNAEAFNRGELQDFSQVGVKVIDDYTLQINLREPVPYLPGVTRHYTWFPVPKHVVLSHGKMEARFTPWCEVGNLVGNGAFQLDSWKLNDHILVKKNPHYWDAANVKLNGVKFLPIENFYTETRAFLAGQLHTTYQVPPDMVPKLEKEYPQFLRKEPYVGSRFMRLNVTRPGLDNVKVREAMALALDRESLCKTVILGFEPSTSYSPRLGDYKPEPVLRFDPERAKQLMAEAGYPDGSGFPRYSILVSSGGTRSTSEAVQAMWKKHLNILVEIRAMDQASYIEAQQKLDFDIALAGWVGDYLDPTTFLMMWTKGNGNNNTGWSSREFESMLQQAAMTLDPAERLRTFEKAERLLMQELPIIPFAWQARNYLHQTSVKGWHPLLLDNHPFSAVSLEEKTTAP
jgi:oligopeptide transport system substrate-binding protein